MAAWVLLLLLGFVGLASARVDASVKSRLLSEAGMREDRVRELGAALLRKKTHHHLIEMPSGTSTPFHLSVYHMNISVVCTNHLWSREPWPCERAAALCSVVSPGGTNIADTVTAACAEWGLPLVVAAKHVIPLWAAGTAAFLAVVLAHSPLSPLPVPPLPHAPVGRFPPRQTVLKVPAPVHVVTVHQTGAHRRWRRRRDAGPGGSTSLAHGDSLQKLVGWLRGELTGVPDRRPLVPPNLRPVAQLAIDTLVRVQPVQVLRAALAVSAAYRVLRLVGSVVVGAVET
ncbi:uncharacterized protein LOC144123694 [Amblyomma americanum]